MSNEQVTPETQGVTAELLAAVDLVLRSRAWRDADFECVW